MLQISPKADKLNNMLAICKRKYSEVRKTPKGLTRFKRIWNNVFLEPPGVRKNNAFLKWSEKIMLFGSGLKK